MIIKNLTLQNFRNYDSLDISFCPQINIIYGNNAQGKTNILEGIYVLCLTKSHRPYVDNRLLKINTNYLKIKGSFDEKILDKKMVITIDEKGKRLEVNNQKVNKINKYIENSSVIIFYPEDLNLIKGSPQERRRYLNIEMSQLYKDYLINLNDYNKLLKMRNDCLKKLKLNLSVDLSYFNIITNYLADRADIIYNLRTKYFDALNEYCTKIYKKISKYDNFKVVYKPNVCEKNISYKETLLNLFKENYKEEIRVGNTLYGPHKDDYYFYIGEKNLKDYGSQGQQRIAILTHKLSEIELFKKLKNEKPILLLDDVFSELDEIKKNLLLEYINNNMQVIITTTDLNNISKDILDKSNIYQIDNGKLISMEENYGK